jgi:hypothetical protein
MVVVAFVRVKVSRGILIHGYAYRHRASGDCSAEAWRGEGLFRA